MSRDVSGNYSLPLPPVVTGTTIEAAWANSTLDDVKAGLTDSLSRTGNGGMQAPLKNVDGAAGTPAVTFGSEANSGIYRAAANDVRIAIAGADKLRCNATGVQFYSGAEWKDPLFDAPSDGTTYGRKDGAWVEVVTDLAVADIPITETDRLLGRDTDAAGPAEEITVGGGLEFTGTGGIQRSALSGDVTAAAGSGETSLAPNVVDLDELAHSVQGEIIYYGLAGEPFRLAPGTAGQVLKTGGIGANPYWDTTGDSYVHPNHTGDVTSVGDGAQTIAANAVTFAKMQDIDSARILGRITAAAGDPEALTGTQVTTLLDAFTSTLKGLAPASGGGTTNFLRADGTWAEPPGGAGGGDSFTTVAVTDTDSGHTWSDTGSIVVDTASDTMTFVSGTGMEVDASPTTDAIRFALLSAQTGITSIYNSSLQVGYSATAYMDYNASSFDVYFSGVRHRFESDGDFHADGNIYAYSTTTGSDIKLKENLCPIDDALGKLLELRGYTYDLKRTKERRAGLIAQDVQLVLPEAVFEADDLEGDGTHLQLDYNAVIALLVNAVIDLNEKIADMEMER